MATVQSVDRAISIMEILAKYPQGISIKELSNHLDLPKSTVHRLLSTLMNRNLVRQDVKTEHYSLGMKIVSLSSSLLDSLDIRKEAREYLEELSDKTNEIVHLCIREDDEVIYMDKVEGDQTIRIHSQIGKRAMLHCTAVGKVFLSHLENDEVNEIIERKGLPKFTENTFTVAEDLFHNLSQIQKNGFAIDEVENEEGIRCIAAPIYDYTKSVIAAISISGPVGRVTTERIEGELLKEILHTASEISKRMGFFDHNKI